MYVIPPRIRRQLKRPLGPVHTTYEKIKQLSNDYKIVAVGDICTLTLIAIGIKPHLAVFDFKERRRKLKTQLINVLKFHFKNIKQFKNRKGTISKRLLKAAPALLKRGGAVCIDGEEDLTALAFARYADKNTLIIYGQPYSGIVVVFPTKETKKKIDDIFKELTT